MVSPTSLSGRRSRWHRILAEFDCDLWWLVVVSWLVMACPLDGKWNKLFVNTSLHNRLRNSELANFRKLSTLRSMFVEYNRLYGVARRRSKRLRATRPKK